MDNELVRYSRAGDVFHYRWAARRCLRMIHPKSSLSRVVIEGSEEKKIAGEYVIDVAEYSTATDGESEEIAYFQLKHSTKRVSECFDLSDLKNTIEGFAKRYRGLASQNSGAHRSGSVKFSIVTNRPINDRFKEGVLAIAKAEAAEKRFQATLKKYTGLEGPQLREFCASLELVDGEGNYDSQRHALHAEMSDLLAGSADNPQIENVIALVQERALPHSDGKIVREDILKRFGVTGLRDLFPAPPEFEEVKHLIQREQHETLLSNIVAASAPIIIHAAGGVGKSVVSRQLAQSLPIGSLGIVYDCFGSGKYRNRSEPRHRHRDALVQLANEIASFALCEPLVPRSTDLDDALLRAFLARIRAAAAALRKVNPDAMLVVFIDAADNAEMAAKEFNEPCFAHQLLREPVPDGCRIVALSRTERINLLEPATEVRQFELKPFSEAETLVHLKERFPTANQADGLEFYRMTGGNPRVQANSLSIAHDTVSDVLASLGPSGTTIDEQIAAQLNFAVSSVKEAFPVGFQQQIEAICLSLANLPPLIPIDVLATVAGVNVAALRVLWRIWGDLSGSPIVLCSFAMNQRKLGFDKNFLRLRSRLNLSLRGSNH